MHATAISAPEPVEGQNSATTKSTNSNFKTISEVAELLGIETHVLRFWETKFQQIKPLKRRGGRRFYREEDVQILQSIQHLLHVEGYTIKGAQKLLKKAKGQKLEFKKPVASLAPAPTEKPLANPVFPVEKDGQLSLVVEEGLAGVKLNERVREELKKCLEDLQKIKKIMQA